MALELKVKLIEGPNLDEIAGLEGLLKCNLDNGNLELYRTDGELPFFTIPWQDINEFDGETKGKLSKKKNVYITMKDNSVLNIEVHEKTELKVILLDLRSFLKSAEEKFPKGAGKRAIESISDVISAIGDILQQATEKAKAGLGRGILSAKNGIGKITKKKE